MYTFDIQSTTKGVYAVLGNERDLRNLIKVYMSGKPTWRYKIFDEFKIDTELLKEDKQCLLTLWNVPKRS